MECGINGSISIGFESRTVHTSYKINGVCISTLIICVKCCPVCLHSLFFSLYTASTAAVCSVMPSGLCQGGTIQKQIERQWPEAWRAKQATLSNCACLYIYSKQSVQKDLWSVMLDSDHIHTKAYLRKTVSIVLPTILENSTLAEDINYINGLYLKKWDTQGKKYLGVKEHFDFLLK